MAAQHFSDSTMESESATLTCLTMLEAFTAPPLLLVMRVTHWYAWFYCMCLMVLLWYKGAMFEYPPGAVLEELMILILLTALQQSRLALGTRACKTQDALNLGIFVWLALPGAFLICYGLNFQVYVLRVEEVICAVALGFMGLEVVLGLLLGFSFAGHAESRLAFTVLGLGFTVFVGMLVFAAAYDAPVKH
jgi:hypothetical protein